MRRREFLTGVTILSLSSISTAQAANANAALVELERSTGGRLGVFVLDTASRRRIAYRANERFAMCSTFKLLLSAAVLVRVDRGQEQLDARITYSRSDLLPHSPQTEKNVATGSMTVEALCAAVNEYSDNAAANLLLASIGGPPAYTTFARSIGDSETRLDRNEPALNSAIPGDPRDTTSPFAMATDMQRVLLGPVLSNASRTRLIGWLKANTTGDARLRAGLPKTWSVGDKTGTGGANNAHGDSNTGNDIAIVWPPGRAPLIVTVYLTQCVLPAAERDAAIASVGKLVANSFYT